MEDEKSGEAQFSPMRQLAASHLPEWTQKAALVYGPRKGGTTLLQNLLDGSDHLVVFPTESKFKRFLTHWLSSVDAVNQYYRDSLLLGVKFPNFDDEGYAREIANLKLIGSRGLREIIQSDAYAVFQYILAKPRDPRMFVMKEVGGHPQLVVGCFRQQFGDGKVILIVRQPRFVSRSVFRERRRKGVRLTFMQMLREAIDPQKVLHHQAEILKKDPNVHLVYYEDMVVNPKQELSKIARYLDIPYSDAFERPTIFGQSVVVRTSSRQTSDVFHDNADWSDGLTLIEKMAVRLGEGAVRIFEIATGRRFTTYQDLRAHGKARSPLPLSGGES